MSLRVIRYKNYGCQITSEDLKEKFYFSFYELNNGKIINLFVIHNPESIQYDFFYTKIRLKTGEIWDYKFGNAKGVNDNEMSKEFFKWFDYLPPVKDLINTLTPNSDEEKCVKDFYLKYLESQKNIKTDVVEVSGP